MKSGLQHASGRVIALGRLLLATLFPLAIWVDVGQAGQSQAEIFAILTAYFTFAAALVVLTWSNWWLDARLAGPAHGVDILLFTLLVLLTEGYTSPFFTFFMFLLLSAAIRWGWYATALTAVLLTLLYVTAGLLVGQSNLQFELQPFVLRTGHLVILSLILIWFGANQWQSRLHFRDDDPLARPSLDESPFEAGLRAAMSETRAASGIFVWREQGRGNFTGLAIRGGELASVALPGIAIVRALVTSPFLYDLGKDHALKKDAQRNLTDFSAGDVIPKKTAANLRLTKGLAIPLRADGLEGELFLEAVPGLSTDHIDLGEQIGADLAAHIRGHAMLKAVEESAEARSRLTLARDLHDSVVQFLAGAAFRLEAMKRSKEAGRDFGPELDELKQLMLQEQSELRYFITALRSGPVVAFRDLAADLKSLAGRLSRQWDVRCEFSAQPADLMIPARLHLDAHQLTREAVANAVRHAEAKSISIKVAAGPDLLQLDFINDGTVGPAHGDRLEMPLSLRERVEEGGGTFDMARGMGVTKISITLPIGGRRP